MNVHFVCLHVCLLFVCRYTSSLVVDGGMEKSRAEGSRDRPDGSRPTMSISFRNPTLPPPLLIPRPLPQCRHHHRRQGNKQLDLIIVARQLSLFWEHRDLKVYVKFLWLNFF